MSDYLYVLMILTAPLLIFPVKTARRGLVTGLFISLLQWGEVSLWLALVPFSVAAFLYVQYGSFSASKPPAPPHVRKPSHRLFSAFVVLMMIFFSFDHSVLTYGSFIQISPDFLQAGAICSSAAGLLGPVLFGIWCDRKGPFGAAVFLALLSEMALWLAAAGESSPGFWLAGTVAMKLSSSGYFVLLPMIFLAFTGEKHFSSQYPAAILLAALTAAASKYFSASPVVLAENAGNLLITLVFLPLFAAGFIFIAWQSRFVLVGPGK